MMARKTKTPTKKAIKSKALRVVSDQVVEAAAKEIREIVRKSELEAKLAIASVILARL